MFFIPMIYPYVNVPDVPSGKFLHLDPENSHCLVLSTNLSQPIPGSRRVTLLEGFPIFVTASAGGGGLGVCAAAGRLWRSRNPRIFAGGVTWKNPSWTWRFGSNVWKTLGKKSPSLIIFQCLTHFFRGKMMKIHWKRDKTIWMSIEGYHPGNTFFNGFFFGHKHYTQKSPWNQRNDDAHWSWAPIFWTKSNGCNSVPRRFF